MAKVKVVTFERSIPLAPVAEQVASRAYLASDGDPLHLHRHGLAPGSTLNIQGKPTDICVYVFEGAVTVCGHLLARGASMIVECGGAADLAAGPDGAVILAFNQAERTTNAPPGGHLHLLPRHAVPTTHDLGTQNEMGGGIHADAACPTCTVWLHENDFHCTSGTTVPLHSHSEDEIIFVTKGAIKLGNRLYGAGTALAIAADTVYGFEAAATGLSFINFRAASPTVKTPHGVHDEAQMWLAALGRPPYATLAAADA